MTIEAQRKKKLLQLMKDFIQLETMKNKCIPPVINNYILHTYGLCAKSQSENVSDEEIGEFVTKLENFLREKFRTNQLSDHQTESTEMHTQNSFMRACDFYRSAKCDYLHASLQLLYHLNEVSQFREKYSQRVKEKSSLKQCELEILEKKLHFLKLRSYLKFYCENNVFDAHLILRKILSEKLKTLKSRYAELVELNAKYDDLKNSKNYCDLLQTYKELLKREMKIDYMMEI